MMVRLWGGVRIPAADLHKVHSDAAGWAQEDKLAFSCDQTHINYHCWAKMGLCSERPSLEH